jgi:DNA replication protein DnaC
MQAVELTELDRAKNALWLQITKGYPKDASGKTTYKVDEHNGPVLADLAKWMVDAPCQWAAKGAGIVLAGGVGSGKTDIMRSLSATITAGGGEGFEIASCVEIVKKHDRTSRDDRDNGGSKIILHYGNMASDLCLDDLGEEPEGKHFGTKCEVIAEILALRYNLWKRRGYLTHFTTNIITTEAMLDKYGQRFTDRIFEMNRVLPLDGPTRRGNATPKMHDRPKLFELPPPQPSPEEMEAERGKDQERFGRIYSEIDKARKELAAEPPPAPVAKMEVVDNSIDKDLIDFAGKVMQMLDSELDVIKEKISLDASQDVKDRFMEIVDKEIEARKQAYEKDPVA